MGSVLRLTQIQWQSITAHLTKNLPNEACGLLAGPKGDVQQVYLITNADHSPISYDMEPRELLDALVDIDAHDWDVLGIFHSHPSGPPVPSPTDIAQAYYPDSAYVIFAPASNQWQARVFEIREGVVTEGVLAVG